MKHLYEILDKPYEFTAHPDTPDNTYKPQATISRYHFKSSNQKFHVNIIHSSRYQQPGHAHIEFESNSPKFEYGAMHATNEEGNSAHRVYSTMAAIMKHHMSTHPDVHTYRFTGYSDHQEKVYGKLLNRYAKKNNMNTTTDYGDFLLGKKPHSQNENYKPILNESQYSKYISSFNGSEGTYDKRFFHKKKDELISDTGEVVGSKHRLIPKSTLKSRPNIIPNPDFIYRGISHDEYENIHKTGWIKSKGEYNIGNEQKGLTYFTTNPSSAESYSSTFAPRQYKPTFKKPAYIIAIRKPHDKNIVKIKGTGDDEVGVNVPIHKDDISEIHRGTVVAHSPQSTHLHWERLK